MFVLVMFYNSNLKVFHLGQSGTFLFSWVLFSQVVDRKGCLYRYRVNNKAQSREVKTSPFSLLQSQPGELLITSIAHQQKMCKASVTDLRYEVHPLPSAQVGHGKRLYQDIHEGLSRVSLCDIPL